MSKYSTEVSKKKTPQMEQAREDQVQNNAGGFVFSLDKWGMLDRFLILGAETNTYYATKKSLVKDNYKNVQACLDEDGLRAVNRVAEISLAGRAPKNDPAIFVLALAAAHKNEDTRRAAIETLPKVCRIGTHLFQFYSEVKEFREIGTLIQRGIAAWYTGKKADKLGYQVAKYQQRGGVSHKDMLRLSHPHAPTPEHEAVFRYITSGPEGMGERKVTRKGRTGGTYAPITAELPSIIRGLELVRGEQDANKVVKLITDYGLTHEMIPTEAKNSKDVWAALLETMPPGAMVRNLGKMTSIGLIAPLSEGAKKVVSVLSNREAIHRARLHPISILAALGVYRAGKGVKGSLTWSPEGRVIDALDEAFYLAFENVEPTGKNLLLGVDISGSMTMGEVAGMPGITPMVAAAAMSMVTARSEKNWAIFGFSTKFIPLDISPKMRLDAVLKEMGRHGFGGTDCSLPMVHALKNKMDVDAFHVYTDSETWAGHIHPFQALKEYRKKMNKPKAKSIVVGFTSTGFTIADPSDPGMMDVVGFDTAAPQIMADFVRDPQPTLDGGSYRTAPEEVEDGD